MNKLTAGCICEFIGTFALMFVGGAAILHNYDQGNIIAVALAHGLILSVMVSATMHISGGQFNPAVSIALAIIKRQPVPQAVAFCVCQLLGASAAAKLLQLSFTAGAVDAGKLGATLGALSNSNDMMLLFALEFVATAFLMFVILGSAVDSRGVGGNRAVGGSAIGLCVAANIFCFGPLTGASMNPARSFGPAWVGGYWDVHWVYWAAPILAAVVTAIVYDFVLIGRNKA
ncbi:MAG: MIP/aquaporin family protein [Phycisphaerales bacterium]